MLVAGLAVASCIGPGQSGDPLGPVLASAGESATQTVPTVTSDETARATELLSSLNTPVLPGAGASETAPAQASPSVRASLDEASPGGRRVSLRPRNNVDADNLLDHWGHRRNDLLSAGLSEAEDPDVEDFRELLDDAREDGAGTAVPELREGDSIEVLGQRRGIAYGRWTGGPADTLSIGFDLQYLTGRMGEDRLFQAALKRSGKVWSHRIDDTWGAWERRAGESKGRLIANRNARGREIRVEPGGETSTGLVIFVTGADLGEAAGSAGPMSVRPDAGWEPHTGAMAFDRDYVEEASEASLFATMVHETGHVIGSWLSEAAGKHLASYIDRDAGTWTGPNVVAVHGGPAPFQDGDDAHAWHDGERDPDADASNIDYAHSGVCASVMSYCRHGGAVPAFLPAEIDFAFLEDLGLSIRAPTDRAETYGLAGWMDHSAFTLSVSREFEVSLADPQPRYHIHGGVFGALDTVDLLWAEADAFGDPSTGDLAHSFPLEGTVRYSGGLVGTAVELPGLPPVLGNANLAVALDTLTGKASFTSLQTLFGGERHLFAGGSLHYPIAVGENAITHTSTGVSLMADFYGPQHQEVAGTIDDSRAGLVASFGAKHDDRPGRDDVISDADTVKGVIYRSGLGESLDGWLRFRCGSGPNCEVRKSQDDWADLPAGEYPSPRDRVLRFTAGWGEWLSEDMFADRGWVRIARRSGHASDGGTGRYQQDGYHGTMQYAAFGTGFYRFHDYLEDGEVWDYYAQGSGYQGDLSGTRPAGGAHWDGLMVGYQWGGEVSGDRFLQGRARVQVSFGLDRVDIDFSDVKSLDLSRSVADFGFGNLRLGFDGTFSGYDGGNAEGAFFGPAHEEAAGMFFKNDNQVSGSFGAVRGE